MGYYLRFISPDRSKITLSAIEEGLKSVDNKYAIQVQTEAKVEGGDLLWDKKVYAEIELNRKGEGGLLEEEIDELRAAIEDEEDEVPERLTATLDSAQTIVAVQVLFEGRQSDETVARFDPLWDWLFKNSTGLLQIDEEGFYDENGIIFEVF